MIDLKGKLQELPQEQKVVIDKINEAVINALSSGFEVGRDAATVLALFKDCKTLSADEMDDKNLVSQILRKLYDLVESYKVIKDTINKETLQRKQKCSIQLTMLEESISLQDKMVKFYKENKDDSLEKKEKALA